MKPGNDPLHSWDVSPTAARKIQEALRDKVICRDQFGEITTVAGVDVGFPDQGTTTRAAIAVLAYPGLQLLEQVVACQPTRFPYVPGLLSFREIPAILAAFEQLDTRPDLVLCDGQGLAHPRRFGIACHLGVLADLPTIGVAKSRLTGTFTNIGDTRGSQAPLMDGNEQIGVVLRTRARIKPIFISIGHRICLNTAIHYVMACTPCYRLPETTRWADRIASRRYAKP